MNENNEDVRYVYDNDVKGAFYENNITEKPNTNTRVKKGVKLAIAAGVVVVIVVIGLILKFTIAERNRTINFNENCLYIEISGYDTIGKAIVKRNYNEIKKVAMPVFERIDAESADKLFTEFFNEMDIVVDKSNELCNGDKVSISISISNNYLEELGIKVSNTEYVKVVSDLEKVVVANPFDYVEIYAKENLSLLEECPIYFTYNDNSLGLTESNFFITSERTSGNEYLYRLVLSDVAVNMAISRGIIFEQIEYSFKIDELEKVILTNFDSISQETLFVAKTTAKREIEALYDKSTEFSVDECDYYGGWLSVKTSFHEGNELVLIYKVITSQNEGLTEPVTTYSKVVFSNVEADANITDDGVLMGYGAKFYDEYLPEVLSAYDMKISFDENGNINE